MSDDDTDKLWEDITEVKAMLSGHEVRFDNGRKVMADMKADIDALKPKAPDWVKLLLAGLSIVGVLMGAQLWLTDRFSERPTESEVEKRIAPIEASEEKTAKEIRSIRDEQIEQRTLIKHVKEAQKDQDEKLSDILDRLPERRHRRE